MRSLITLLLFTLSVFRAIGSSPEEVITAYFQKVKAEGFVSIAELMHPHELRKFQDMLLPIVTQSLATEEVPTFKLFASGTDPKKPAKMTDAEFMNRFMTWVSESNPALRQIISGASIETLGHVVEGDFKHVVVRMKMSANGIDIDKLSVMTVKDFEGKTLMTLSGEMRGVADSFKNMNPRAHQ
jgi:hypothetical protein